MLQTLVSIAGAGGIALLVPFAILLVGLPVALIVRGLIEIVLWLFPALAEKPLVAFEVGCVRNGTIDFGACGSFASAIALCTLQD